jgi:hypothetical protein
LRAVIRILSQAFTILRPRHGSCPTAFELSVFSFDPRSLSIAVAGLGGRAVLAGGNEQFFVVVDLDRPSADLLGAAMSQRASGAHGGIEAGRATPGFAGRDGGGMTSWAGDSSVLEINNELVLAEVSLRC